MKIITIDVDPGQSTMRLDHYLPRRINRLSRTYAQGLIKNGHVTIDGKVVTKSSLKIAPRMHLLVEMSARVEVAFTAADIPLDVLYEDDQVLVVNKQAGLVVHPAFGHFEGTLLNAALYYLGWDGASERPTIVHRLDKDTSGVMVIAKSEASRGFLQKQFQRRAVTKTYEALVKGIPASTTATIDAPLARDPRNRKRMTVFPSGREAHTRYELIASYRDEHQYYSRLAVQIMTGRTHQIRVHLASIGHPIIGDDTYGVPNASLTRQFLHASKLTILLPGQQTTTTFVAPLAADLNDFLQNLITV